MSENTIQQTISLNDFRSWLQGVEDMQEEGWVPSATQWNKIRQKIDQIVETPQRVLSQPTGPMVATNPSHQVAVPRPAPMVPPPSSSLDSSSPRVSTFVPPQPRSENPKTPDIDTSNGQYTTSFA